MYAPPLVTVPPVAVNVAVTAAVLPSLRLPTTENCWLAPAVSVTEDGVSTMPVIGGSVTFTVLVSAKVPAAGRSRDTCPRRRRQ